MWSRYFIYITMATGISILQCMEQQITPAFKEPAKLLRKQPTRASITYAMICHARSEIDLDQMFDYILPREITHKIVCHAYQRDFLNYFFSPDTAKFFFGKAASASCHPLYNNNLVQQYITSCPNVVHEYPDLPQATCVIKPQDPYWSHFVGFEDGRIRIYAKNGFEHGFEPMNNNAPITALCPGPSTFEDEDSNQPFIIVGYKDGSITFLNKTRYSSFKEAVRPMKEISLITPGPLLNSYSIVYGDDIITLYRFDGPSSNTNEGTHVGPLPFSIVGIGSCGHSVIAKLAGGNLIVLKPYLVSDHEAMSSCQFSPQQASCIYRIIQQQNAHIDVTLTPEETKIFTSLLPKVQEVIQMKSMKK